MPDLHCVASSAVPALVPPTLAIADRDTLRRPSTGGRASSDEALLGGFRAGDVAAFDAIAARYRGRLVGYALRVMHGSDEAQDAVQDVLISAQRSLVSDERPIALGPWLHRATHNRCLDRMTRSARRASPLTGYERSTFDVAATVEGRAALRDLLADIDGLPTRQRSALLIRELEGLSYQQLATRLDCSVAAVKSLLTRARADLAETIRTRERANRPPPVGPRAGRGAMSGMATHTSERHTITTRALPATPPALLQRRSAA